MSKKNKNKNGKLKLIPIFIIALVIGMALGVLVAMWIETLEVEADQAIVLPLFMIGACVLSYFFAIIIHETGHLVMGLSTGYEFVSFRIGSFTIIRENGKLARRKFHIVGTGGQCILTYKAVDNPQDIPYFWYHFGGVFFNFLTAIICLPVILLAGNNFVLVGFVMLAIISVIVGITNIIPTKVTGVGTDGYNIRLFKRSVADRIAIYKAIRINALQYQGVQLENMSDELLSFSEDEKNCALGMALTIIEANLLMYRHNFKEAEEKLRLIVENENAYQLYRNECSCDMLFCMIMNGCSSEEIDKVYNKSLAQYIRATGKYYVSRKRLLYAYYLVIQKNSEKATAEYEMALKMKNTYPATGEYLSEESLMNYVGTTSGEISAKGIEKRHCLNHGAR